MKLLPDEAARSALEHTLTVCNTVATDVSAVAQERGVFNGYDLRTITYGMAKEAGLSAQPAQQAIRKVVQAYKTRKSNAKNGNYGPWESPRCQRIMSTPIQFRPDAAQPYDDRCLSWCHDTRSVSIWTTVGRLRIPFIGKRRHMRELAAHRKGESDLVKTGGEFYLYATVDLTEPTPITPAGHLGIDLGQENLAVTSDGVMLGSGGQLRKLRESRIAERKGLQKRGTTSAKRKLKKKSGRESRRMTDINHCIAKQIVAEAQRTGRGIALEELSGIRRRARHRKPQRATFHSWAFAQLSGFIAYKAIQAGIPVTIVDPAYTSQGCSTCGHIDKKNRPTQEKFSCTSCGMTLHADINAARNIAQRGDHDYQAALGLAA